MAPFAGRIPLAACLLLVPTLVRAETPEPRARLKHDGPVTVIAFSPDGKLLAAGDKDSSIRLWNVATGKQERLCEIKDGEIVSLAFSLDGKLLGSASTDGIIRLWDVATGKERRALPKSRFGINYLAFAPDGRTLAVAAIDGNVRLWDVVADQEVRLLTVPPHVWSVGFSADGKVLAAGSAGATRQSIREVLPLPLWDVSSGKELRHLKMNSGKIVFAPDGKTIAAYPQDEVIRFWETASGKLRGEFKAEAVAVAFAPDGRLFAWADEEDSHIHLRDLWTGKELMRLEEHEVEVTGLAFSPDGKTLASASGDFSVLLWDVPALVKHKPLPLVKLGKQDLEAHWEKLTEDDPAKALAAARILQQAPGQSLPLIRERLRTVFQVGNRRLKQLVADLDNSEFKVRQKATEELERLGGVAEPALQEVLANKPSLEVRRRVEGLLEKLEKQSFSPEQLRVLRAIEVMEALATPEARQALTELTQQDPPTLVSHEARAALKRLSKRR